MQIPEFLKTGDKVMVISPSGKIEEEIVKKGMDVLSDWGLDPIPGMACLSRCGRFAGDDNVRLDIVILHFYMQLLERQGLYLCMHR